jgi:hypothetical protein
MHWALEVKYDAGSTWANLGYANLLQAPVADLNCLDAVVMRGEWT